MVSPCAIIRAASLSSVGLNLRDGRLYGPPETMVPPDLAAAIRAHKPAVVAALNTLATSPNLRDATCTRSDVPPLNPVDADEAEALASVLTRTGGLAQFVCDLFHTWNDLTPADRAAACHAWRLVVGDAPVVLCDNLACPVLGPCETYLNSGACAFLPTTAARAA